MRVVIQIIAAMELDADTEQEFNNIRASEEDENEFLDKLLRSEKGVQIQQYDVDYQVAK